MNVIKAVEGGIRVIEIENLKFFLKNEELITPQMWICKRLHEGSEKVDFERWSHVNFDNVNS